jgi:hypothetical protein
MKQNDGDTTDLKELLLILVETPVVSAITLARILSVAPNWLVQKQQLFPSEQLANKLSNLRYQLHEFIKGEALDIEDHWEETGVGQADLTYLRSGRYHFVDVTTSRSPTLLLEKSARLKDASSKVEGSTWEVRTIPNPIVMNLSQDLHPSADLWESFNRMMVRSSASEQLALHKAVTGAAYPALKAHTWARALAAAEAAALPPLEGDLECDLSRHPVTWASEHPALLEHWRKLLAITSTAGVSSPLTVPIPQEPLRIPTYSEAWGAEDPVLAAGLLALLCPPSHRGWALRLPFGSMPEEWEVFADTESKSMAEFRYHGEGAVRAQTAALSDPDPKVLYLLVSNDVAETPKGLIVPKGFSVAVGKGWSGYSAEMLTRGFDAVLTPKEGYVSDGFVPVSLDHVQAAQDQHDAVLRLMSSRNRGRPASLASKVVAASRVTKGLEWAGLIQGAIPSKSQADQVPIMDTVLFSCLSAQYDVARVVSAVLSEKHSPFRFRLCVAGPDSLLVAVGTGNSVSRMKDAPIMLWSPSALETSVLPRSRSRTISVSSRLLAWWLRLPFVVLCRASMAVQHNLPLPRGSLLADGLESVVEHALMHLTTRQQDSLMQDQVRYVLAGLMSPDPDPVGPLAKVHGVWLKNPHTLVYWARLCRLQAASYLSKRGLGKSLEMSQDAPPSVVPPQHSTICSTFPLYVDAMFDSKVFNKDKAHVLDSQALDWLGMMENEVQYRAVEAGSEMILRGCSSELGALVSRCVQAGTLYPLVADITSDDSLWIRSMTSWWEDISGGKTAVDFGWNAPACYTIFMTKLAGRRLTETVGDYTGVLADLGAQSLTSFMSSSGSTAKGEANAARQSVRKSTAMLGFYADNVRGEDIPYQDVGVAWVTLAHKNPSRHQSLLLASLWQINDRGRHPLVSRTMTKPQSAGGREFSAMNAIGIVSCRAAERIFAQLLPGIPTDRMTDPDTDGTLFRMLKSKSEQRTLFMAADNRRFGPFQVMPKSRALAACLCISDNGKAKDTIALAYTYEVLAEPTRRMQDKYSKMPQELLEAIIKFGGWKKVAAKKPTSTLGKLATLMVEQLGEEKVQPGFTQKWGMYQGALGMYSSCASSLLHEFAVEIILDQKLAKEVETAVTNDDSNIIARQIAEDIALKLASAIIKWLLALVLGLGGQLLNMFKTVLSTILAEFHSTFGTKMGLIAAEFKTLVAGLQFGRGEKISDDALRPIEEAVNALRAGCSVFSSTTLAVCLTVAHCDQYNRWKGFKKNGVRPADLGGPVEVDLLKEIMVPGFGSLAWYVRSAPSASDLAIGSLLASSFVASEVDGLLQLEQAGVKMTTRHVHRQARGNNEVRWCQPEPCIPLSGQTAIGPLAATVSTGLLRGSPDGAMADLLVRFGRNQVSASNANLEFGEGHWARAGLGHGRVSYDLLDSIGASDFTEAIGNLSDGHPNTLVALARHGLGSTITAVRSAALAPPTLPLLLRGKVPTTRSFFVAPVSVRRLDRAYVPPSTEAAIRVWGSAPLQARLSQELRGHFDPETMLEFKPELTSVTATVLMFNKLVKARSGPFKMVEPPSLTLSPEAAAIALSTRVFRGLVSVSPVLMDAFSSMSGAVRGGMDMPPAASLLKYGDLVAGLSIGRVITARVFEVPTGDLRAVWDKAPLGWVASGASRVKVKRVSRRTRRNGRLAWDTFAIVTRQTGPRGFSHWLLGVSQREDLTAAEGVPAYMDDAVRRVVLPGDIIPMTDGEEITVVGPGGTKTLVLREEPWAVWAVSPGVTFPIRRQVPAPSGGQYDWDGILPSPLDVFVYLSGGAATYSDKRTEDVAMLTRDNMPLESWAAEFGTQRLLSELRTGPVPKRPPPSDAWDHAAGRMGGFLKGDPGEEQLLEVGEPGHTEDPEDEEATSSAQEAHEEDFTPATAEERAAFEQELQQAVDEHTALMDAEADRIYAEENRTLEDIWGEGYAALMALMSESAD